jgi:hypothetical protein
VVLRVEHAGGFVAPETIVTALPLLTLYGDGRVVTMGSQIAIYPSPALPSLNVRTVTATGITKLVQAALDAGVGSSADYGTPAVADAPDTVFTVVSNGLARQSRVLAFDFDGGLTRDQVAARQRLHHLVDLLEDLPGTVGAENVGDETPYEAQTVAALARPWFEPGLPQQLEEKTWPGPALPGPDLPRPPVTEMRCLTVSGTELAAVLEVAHQANVLTPWVWDGERYFVNFRPLLPDESTCADLTS